MIPKDERERDKAICDAAPKGTWEAERDPCDDDDSNLDIVADDGIVAYALEPGAGDAIANAANRLPVYIAALDEIEARLVDMEERAKMLRAAGVTTHAAGMREVIAYLRGGQ